MDYRKTGQVEAHYTVPRAGFSLSRALFKKCGAPSIIYENRCASEQGCVSVISWQQLT